MAGDPIDWRLYAPFRRLVQVRIGGRDYLLPENNPLLRGFQFLDPGCLAYGNFCWNADCRTCVVRIEAGAPGGAGLYLACQVEPVAGMRLASPPRGVKLPAPEQVRAYAGIRDGEVVDGPEAAVASAPVDLSDREGSREPGGGGGAGDGGDPGSVEREGPGLGGDDPSDPRP